VELDEEHAFASPMPCHLKEIADAGEAAFVGETRGDLFERDRDDGIDLNLTFFEAVSPAGTNVRTHPDTNASRDRTASHAIAQVFREKHRASLTLGRVPVEEFLQNSLAHRRLAALRISGLACDAMIA
jgi:hypothetical protein